MKTGQRPLQCNGYTFSHELYDVLRMAKDRVDFRQLLDDGFTFAVSYWYADKKLKRAQRLFPELHFEIGDAMPMLPTRQNRFISKRQRQVAKFPEEHPAFFHNIEESRNAGHITVRKRKTGKVPILESYAKRQLKALV